MRERRRAARSGIAGHRTSLVSAGAERKAVGSFVGRRRRESAAIEHPAKPRASEADSLIAAFAVRREMPPGRVERGSIRELLLELATRSKFVDQGPELGSSDPGRPPRRRDEALAARSCSASEPATRSHQRRSAAGRNCLRMIQFMPHSSDPGTRVQSEAAQPTSRTTNARSRPRSGK